MITLHDFKAAIASLSNAKSYVLTVVLSLGLSLGALVALFNLNYQVLVSPLPYPEPEELQMFKGTFFENGELLYENEMPYPSMIKAYRESDDWFSEKAMISYGTDVERSRSDNPSFNTAAVTPEYFSMIDAPFHLGRGFTKNEGFESDIPVAVLSFNSWNNLYQQDPSVIGKTVNFRGTTFKIVGVLSNDFAEPALFGIGWKSDIFLSFDHNDIDDGTRTLWFFSTNQIRLVGRLHRAEDAPKAQHEFHTILSTQFKDESSSESYLANTTFDVNLLSYKDVTIGDSRNHTLLLFLGALALLLIAATNIANLIMSRAVSQQRNMAIKAALGGHRKHIFNALFAEIASIVGLAVLFSILISVGVIEVIKTAGEGHLPRLQELHLSAITLAFAVLMGFLLSLVFAYLVSHQVNYKQLNTMLQSSGKHGGLQVSKNARTILVVSQIALAGALLSITLQVFQKSWTEVNQDLGYNLANSHQVSLNIGSLLSAEPPDQVAVLLDIVTELNKHPKIIRAGISDMSPVSLWSELASSGNMTKEFGSDKVFPVYSTTADKGFMDIYQFELVAGRYYTEQEVNEGTRVMMINEQLSKQFSSSESVIGKSLFWAGSRNPKPFIIIGVFKNIQLPGTKDLPRVIRPSIPIGYPELLIQTLEGQEISAVEINEVMNKVNPQVKVFSLHASEEIRSMLTANQELAAGLTAIIAILTFALGSVGVYGVLKYNVELRRHEFGIRMAIGARPFTILINTIKENMVPVTIGLFVSLLVLAGIGLLSSVSQLLLPQHFFNWLTPLLLILLLSVFTTAISLWSVICKPAMYSMRQEN